MRFKDILYPDKKRILFHYVMGDVILGGGDFRLCYLPESGRYETEGRAVYDGYIKNQYDNFEEAWVEFSSWVGERQPVMVNQMLGGLLDSTNL